MHHATALNTNLTALKIPSKTTPSGFLSFIFPSPSFFADTACFFVFLSIMYRVTLPNDVSQIGEREKK